MNALTTLFSRTPVAIAVCVLLLAAGCGGGGGGTGSSAAPSQAAITGSVVKGPVAGATVGAYAVQSGAMGALIGSATTDTQGNFSMSLGTYSGPVMMRASGGHFVNEASGADMPMQSGDVMTAMIPSVGPGESQSGVQITPLTSIAQAMAQRMAGGMTTANMSTAMANVGSYFMVSDILHVRPMDPLVAGAAGTATADMRNYGMALGAMSQLAGQLGMPFTSGLVTAMMNDGSDGCFDGMMAGAPVMMGGGMMGNVTLPSYAGGAGMSNAMADFVRSSQNHSGATMQDMQSLINRLMAGGCPLH